MFLDDNAGAMPADDAVVPTTPADDMSSMPAGEEMPASEAPSEDPAADETPAA